MSVRIVTILTTVTDGLRLKLTRIDWLSRLALTLLTVVLVLSTAFALATADSTRAAAARIGSLRSRSDNLRTAQYALLDEKSLEREYRLSPDADTFTAQRAAAHEFTNAIEAVKSSSEANEVRILDGVLAAHRTYLDDTRQLFVAANKEEVSRVATLTRDRVDPEFGRMTDAISDQIRLQTTDSGRAIAQMQDKRQWVIDVSVALSVVGLGCLGLFILVLSSYRKQLAASHEAELQQFEQAALLDNLTGIGNHRAYKQDLLREISRAERHGEMLSLAILNVDDFRVVNDREGHMQGDRVLSTLANILGSLRAEDRPYRLGGATFAIILPHASVEEAKEAMQRLRVLVATSLFGNTLSIGLATLAGPECDAETLGAQADAAMNAAKRAGRNSLTVFDEALESMWLLSPTKVHNLRQLIASRSVNVVFQPIWDIGRCEILAYEALSRPDPSFGFRGPQDAFDLAERIGRAHELDAVCRNAALARAIDLPRDTLLFINMSPQSLDRGHFDPDGLLSAVAAAGLTPERVVIEITERSITQVEAVIESARELQTHGFRLALDDTGAGNSGLEMLSRLPLEYLKIDREVMVNALVDKNARGVVAGIIAIARATEAYVIAEGIETTEMLEFVRETGSGSDAASLAIAGVQGYLLRRPAAAFLAGSETGDVEALLREFAHEPAHAAII